ncbi:MAG: hypothetical protein ACKVQR_15775 [Aquabacterium sp.]
MNDTAANEPDTLQTLRQVLDSVDALRNGRALWLLLATFAMAGLLLASAQAALGKASMPGAVLWGGLALFATFYGSNAAGLMVMDQACGRPVRDPVAALSASLRCSHRLLIVMLLLAGGLAVIGLLSALLLKLAAAPAFGPLLLGLLVPLLVPALGLTLLALVLLAAPLAAPAVWSGLGVRAVLRLLAAQARRRFVHVLLMTGAVGLLSAVITAGVSFTVLAGGRVTAYLAVLVAGVDLAPDPFLAALFGQGVRVSARGLSAHGIAAQTGAGVVFALGLALPGLVYLRGLCAVFLALQPRRSVASAP